MTRRTVGQRSHRLAQMFSGSVQWLLCIYVLLIPFERSTAIVTGEDSILKPYRVVAMLLVAVWGVKVVFRGRRVRVDWYDLGFTGLFAWGLLVAMLWSTVKSVELSHTWSAFALTGLAFSVHFITKNAFLSREQLERLLLMYILGVAVSLAFGLWIDASSFTTRLRGAYNNPNRLGFAACVALLYFIARIVLDRDATFRRLISWGILAVSSLIVILLSGSRGAIAAAAASCFALLWASARHGAIARQGALRAIFVGALIVGGGSLVGEQLWRATGGEQVAIRYQDDSLGTLGGRYDIWRSAVNVSLDHYLIGVGMGQYKNYHRDYANELEVVLVRKVTQRSLGTHSDFVNLLTNFGAPCLLLYLVLVGRLLWRCLRQARARPHESYLFFLAPALLIAAVVLQMSANLMIGPDFFLLLGVIVCISQLQPSRALSAGAPQAAAVEAYPRYSVSRSLRVRSGAQ